LISKQLSILESTGVNTDVAPWSLPEPDFSDGNNFRMVSGEVVSFGGYELWSESGQTLHNGFTMPVEAASGRYWMVGHRNGVVAFDGAQWVDISSDQAYNMPVNSELLWAGCLLGRIPIVSNPLHVPEYWNTVSLGQPLQPLNFSPGVTWAEAHKSARVFRSHKSFLFALNLQEGANEQPDSYRWSHPADINGLPFTWDENDTSAVAGIAALGGDGGSIIDGRSLRDAFAIYSENAIDILDSTGDQYVWRRRELSSSTGLMATSALVEVKGKHFFLADGDIVMNDGHNLQSLVHNRIRKRLTAYMSTDFYSRSFVVRNETYKEIWFCVPEDGAEYPNTAYIYNWRDNSWAIRDIPEVASADYGYYSKTVIVGESWDDWAGEWDEGIGVWNMDTETPLSNAVVGVTNDPDNILLLEPNVSVEDVETVIERTDLALEGHSQITALSRVYPQMRGPGPVKIEFGSQDMAGGPVRWKPPVTFIPGVNRKVDIRTTGELLAWRMSSKGTSSWSLSGMLLEYSLDGLR